MYDFITSLFEAIMSGCVFQNGVYSLNNSDMILELLHAV